MIARQIYNRPSEAVTATGFTADMGCSLVQAITIDINVAAPGGAAPSITLSWQRKGLDGIYYPVYAFAASTVASVLSRSIGMGAESAMDPGLIGRLAWTLSGTGLSTTVTLGANSATQFVGSTAGMVAGDTLHFALANTDRVIASVTDGTHVVLTAAVTTIITEAVTSATPYIPFSASITGR